MLMFSNRRLQGGPGAPEFGAKFDPFSDRLSFAVADDTTGALSLADDEVVDAEAMELLVTQFDTPGAPVLLYVHGFNNTAPEMVNRCLKLQSTYGVRVVGFTWPAEGLLHDGSPLLGTPVVVGGGGEVLRDMPQTRDASLSKRYKQAKVNATQSADAFGRFLRLVGLARLQANGTAFSAGVHSLGNELLKKALAVPGAADGLASARNVALLAPCVDASGHASWVGTLARNVFVTFHHQDNVLAGATFADHTAKLGADPGPGMQPTPAVRYVDFTGAPVDMAAHRYFIEPPLAAASRKLFRRVFRSEPDLAVGERIEDVYPGGRDASGALTMSRTGGDAGP